MLLSHRRRHGHSATTRRPTCRLSVESLESRLAPATGPFDTPRFAANNALLAAAYGVPQMSLALTTPDGTHTYTATYSGRPFDNPATLNDATLFRIGSVSKTFSAVALLKLVELTANSADPVRLTDSALSRIPVADPTAGTAHYAAGMAIARFDPAFGPDASGGQTIVRDGNAWFTRVSAEVPSSRVNITIAHMLSMTSGCPTTSSSTAVRRRPVLQPGHLHRP
ncbi:MAG: serine hydrolase [Gemmataceae bacterium]